MPFPETLFTPPHTNPDCPDTSRWTASDVDATECEVVELVAAFVRALQPDLVLETGAWYGNTTFAIAAALARNRHGRLLSVEIGEEQAAHARARCQEFGNTEVFVSNSLDFVLDREVQFAWFDSSLGIRELEFRRFYPQLTGIVGFHDTGRHHVVVREQVERLSAEGMLRPIFLRTPRGCAFAEVLHR